ncbi:MAG: hypothetical protein PF495_07840 [Spirochaetales bacterium]|jgi:nickel transport protein|nr:hypothetical protein [Spirochaetales bacterium]
MIKRFYLYSFFMFLPLVFGTDCLAHKITVFGYVDQGMVKTESKFSGGRAAKQCQLSVLTGDSPVFVGLTDDLGMLDFPIPEPPSAFDIFVSCGDGHKGQWRINAEELGAPPEPHIHAKEALPERVISRDSSAIRLIVREELAAELGPMKRQLAQLQQDTVSLADIMGGLGYFLGLAGLASYMRYRRDGK